MVAAISACAETLASSKTIATFPDTVLAGEATVNDVIHSLPMFPTLAESLKIAVISFKKDITGLSCCV